MHEVPQSPGTVKKRLRDFPDFNAVDGVTLEGLSIWPVSSSDQTGDNDESSLPTLYQFNAWSEFDKYSFRISARTDIDRTLLSYDLPPSSYLLENYPVVESDDLDTPLEYADQNIYGFMITITRAEFAFFYQRLVESAFIQECFDDLYMSWIWRDLPSFDLANSNFLVFHTPATTDDITGPLTYLEMNILFENAFPDSEPRGELRLLADSEVGDFSNIYIVENVALPEDNCLKFGRCLQLAPQLYFVTTDPRIITYGCQLVSVVMGDPCEDGGSNDQAFVFPDNDEPNPFGDPDEPLYVDDLIGPADFPSDSSNSDAR